MTLADLQKVSSNGTKLIDYVSDDDCDCLISWHIILWMQANNIGRA